MMLPKTAIIGATGFIGKAFFVEYKKIHPDCIGTNRDAGRDGFSFLDLSFPEIAPLKLVETGHQDVLILAGMTKLAECEKEKELTRKVNVEGTLDLVRQLTNKDIKPIFFSSDIVFDGKIGLYDDESPLEPLNEYARQKVEVESGIKEICRNGKYLIVRLCKTFSINKGDGTLFDEMASALKKGEIVRAAYDQIFSSINILDLVEIVKILQTKNITGVINISPPEIWSRYDLAVALAKSMGEDPGKIEKISLDDLQETFKRPKNTSMKTDKIIRETGYQFTPTRQYIDQVAENWRGNGHQN